MTSGGPPPIDREALLELRRIRRMRRRVRRIVTVLSVLAIAIALALVWLMYSIGTAEEPEPMLGPGTFSDASNELKFDVVDGWEVTYQDGQTRIVQVNNNLPAYTIESKSGETLNLSFQWDCKLLARRASEIADRAAPWPVTLTYVAIPCQNDPVQPVYGRLYVTLADGSGLSSVLVFGPIDGRTWAVAIAEPFAGESSPDMVEAMTQSVRSARRKS